MTTKQKRKTTLKIKTRNIENTNSGKSLKIKNARKIKKNKNGKYNKPNAIQGNTRNPESTKTVATIGFRKPRFHQFITKVGFPRMAHAQEIAQWLSDCGKTSSLLFTWEVMMWSSWLGVATSSCDSVLPSASRYLRNFN